MRRLLEFLWCRSPIICRCTGARRQNCGVWPTRRAAGIALEFGTRGIDPQQLLKYLDISQRLGSPLLRTVIDSEDADAQTAAPVSPVELDRVVGAIREVVAAFEQADVKRAIENHDRFPASTLRDIMQQVDSSHVGICLARPIPLAVVNTYPWSCSHSPRGL